MAAKRKRSNLSNEKARLKYFLWMMIQKHQPRCCFCGELFVYEDVLPSRGTDTLTEHHEDGDHMNMALSNRTLSHRFCHKSHHAKDNILKEKE